MIKVAVIGAGSVLSTRQLTRDILTVPELQDTIFSFTDISERNLDMVTELVRRDIRENKVVAQVNATTDRRAALADANYVGKKSIPQIRELLKRTRSGSPFQAGPLHRPRASAPRKSRCRKSLRASFASKRGVSTSAWVPLPSRPFASAGDSPHGKA